MQTPGEDPADPVHRILDVLVGPARVARARDAHDDALEDGGRERSVRAAQHLGIGELKRIQLVLARDVAIQDPLDLGLDRGARGRLGVLRLSDVCLHSVHSYASPDWFK